MPINEEELPLYEFPESGGQTVNPNRASSGVDVKDTRASTSAYNAPGRNNMPENSRWKTYGGVDPRYVAQGTSAPVGANGLRPGEFLRKNPDGTFYNSGLYGGNIAPGSAQDTGRGLTMAEYYGYTPPGSEAVMKGPTQTKNPITGMIGSQPFAPERPSLPANPAMMGRTQMRAYNPLTDLPPGSSMFAPSPESITQPGMPPMQQAPAGPPVGGAEMWARNWNPAPAPTPTPAQLASRIPNLPGLIRPKVPGGSNKYAGYNWPKIETDMTGAKNSGYSVAPLSELMEL